MAGYSRSSMCKGCGARTTASGGYCRTCQSMRHHALKRIEKEHLIVDTAGGGWWIWDQKGNVLVTGKDTKWDAINALAFGEEINEEADED